MYTTVLSSILIDHSENMNIISLFVCFVLSVCTAVEKVVFCFSEKWFCEGLCFQLFCIMFAQSRVSLTSEEM